MLLMLKTEIFSCTSSQVKNTNNGISSITRTGRVNQPPANGIEPSDLLSIKTSLLFQHFQRVDTLTILVETSSLRNKMVDQAKNGTSISLQELLDLDQLINHSISITPVNPTTCNTTAPAPTGGRCSSTKTDTSLTSEMVRRSPFPEAKMKKLNQFGYGLNTREDTQHKSGELPTLINYQAVMLLPRRVK